MISVPSANPRQYLINALYWALPAIFIGGIIRWWFCQYSPYAYWGSDSESFYSLAYRYWAENKWRMQEKREYVYPLFIWLLSFLPGSTLKLLAFLQHAFGLLTLVPLAYFVQYAFRSWKILVVPVTILYACLPVIVWYEHELLAETLFTAFLIWSMGAWAFWARESELRRGRWWHWFVFLIPFAIFCLTKPSARFVWPGLVLSLIYLKAWRQFHWHHWAATAAVAYGAFTLGESSQGNRLLYSSFFPLTHLESSKHKEYKDELRELVLKERENFDSYFLYDFLAKRFLRGAYEDNPKYPHWAALADKSKEDVSKLMRSLAVEALVNHPILAVKHVTLRVLGSLDFRQFKLRRFEADYFATRYAESYPKFKNQPKNIKMLNMAMGIKPVDEALTLEQFKALTAPSGKEAQVVRVNGIMENLVTLLSPVKIIRPDEESDEEGAPNNAEVTQQAVNPPSQPEPATEVIKLPEDRNVRIELTWATFALTLGVLLSLIHPAYRKGIGLWTIIAASYIFGVHFVGSMNPRFSMQILAILLMLMVLPLDWAIAKVTKRI